MGIPAVGARDPQITARVGVAGVFSRGGKCDLVITYRTDFHHIGGQRDLLQIAAVQLTVKDLAFVVDHPDGPMTYPSGIFPTRPGAVHRLYRDLAIWADLWRILHDAELPGYLVLDRDQMMLVRWHAQGSA